MRHKGYLLEVAVRQGLAHLLDFQGLLVHKDRKKLFTVFVDQQPLKIEEMRQALADGDLKEVAFMAHTLKGGAATMGAEVLKDRAYEVEKAAKTEDADLAEREIEALASELEETIQVMREFMER